MSWNGIHTWTVGERLTAANMNLYVSDNTADLDRRTTSVAHGIGSTQTTSSTTFTDLATPGPAVTVTIGSTGKALVTLYSSFQGDTVGMLVEISYQISGAFSYGPVHADAVTYQVANTGYSARYGATHVAGPGITPGSCTFTMKYTVSSGTGSFLDRRITVTPLGS